MKWFNWQFVLRPLNAAELIDRSLHRYMRKLILVDIEERLKNCGDELDRVLYLDALRYIYEVEDIDGRLGDVRAELARLKKKHRNKITKERKKLIQKFIGI